MVNIILSLSLILISGTEEVPKAGMSLRKLYQPRKEENSVDTLSSSSSNSESEEKEYRPPSKKKKRKLENERKEKKSKKAAKNENEERPRPKKPEKEEQVPCYLKYSIMVIIFMMYF